MGKTTGVPGRIQKSPHGFNDAAAANGASAAADSPNPNGPPAKRGAAARELQPQMGKYKIIRTIGRGNFAKVKLAQHISTGREVCCYCCCCSRLVITHEQFPVVFVYVYDEAHL